MWEKEKLLLNWVVVLGFNATLTAKVIPWQSVTHMCFLAVSDKHQHNFLSKTTDYFSHMLQQRCDKPETMFASTGYRTQNHQVMSSTRPLISRTGGTCSLRAISPFPTVFSKDMCCRHVKKRLI